jgi:hypothetical protein
VERPALKRRQPFEHELSAAVHEPSLLGAVLQRAAGNFVVIGLVWLPEVRRVGKRHGTLVPHPMQGGAGVEAAGKRDPDPLPDWQALKNRRHA